MTFTSPVERVLRKMRENYPRGKQIPYKIIHFVSASDDVMYHSTIFWKVWKSWNSGGKVSNFLSSLMVPNKILISMYNWSFLVA